MTSEGRWWWGKCQKSHEHLVSVSQLLRVVSIIFFVAFLLFFLFFVCDVSQLDRWLRDTTVRTQTAIATPSHSLLLHKWPVVVNGLVQGGFWRRRCLFFSVNVPASSPSTFSESGLHVGMHLCVPKMIQTHQRGRLSSLDATDGVILLTWVGCWHREFK